VLWPCKQVLAVLNQAGLSTTLPSLLMSLQTGDLTEMLPARPCIVKPSSWQVAGHQIWEGLDYALEQMANKGSQPGVPTPTFLLRCLQMVFPLTAGR
jgi:hypothetical protein